jgi:hypothetical protein
LGSQLGYRAVRWLASGTEATELGGLGTDPSGYSEEARAYAVNDAGVAVGFSRKYVSGSDKGDRAVRWDASGTEATELGNLGDIGGYTQCYAYAVNAVGTAVGVADKFGSGVGLGPRAVRWDASGTVATELGNLGTNTFGQTEAIARAVNAAGTAVGNAEKYVSGSGKGTRAVRWDASGTEATELGTLGTDPNGQTYSVALAVNNAGTAFGYSEKYVSGSYNGIRALVWLPNSTNAIDLNELGVAHPSDGSWLLQVIYTINADGWASGYGAFSPNVGPAYLRLWITQVGLGGTWTDVFSGSLNGTWGRGPQWSTGTPAMQVGDAVFNASAAYSVSLDRNETTRSISVSAGDVTLNLNGYRLGTTLGSTIGSGASLKIGSSGAAAITGSITNNGTLAPGVSVGMLNIDGNYTQSASGKLQIELGSLANFDGLQVVGDLVIGGTIEISLLEDYLPMAGNEFDILDWTGALSGTFDMVILPSAINWNTSQLYTQGVISVVGLAGDYNGDNVVDTADYVVWRNNGGIQGEYNTWRVNFGNTASIPGDFNNDDVVNAADYIVWRKNGGTPDRFNIWRTTFGDTFGGAGSSLNDVNASPNVPEPASLGLFAITSVLFFGSRQKGP